jgi:polyhydroxybutyrate depolymerase
MMRNTSATLVTILCLATGCGDSASTVATTTPATATSGPLSTVHDPNSQENDGSDEKRESGENEELGDKSDFECKNSDADGYRTVVQGSTAREYVLHVPESLDPQEAAPLVINFHGFGDCAAIFAATVGDGGAGMNSVADQHDFIVAYPQAVVRGKGGTEWDPGDNGVDSIGDNDVFFVEQLIAEIDAAYNVDRSRLYATGFSNGGMMAYGLACTRGEVFAAVGVMSGTKLDGTCNADEHTSIIHFHGIGDDVLPYDGNDYYQAVPAVIDFWLDHNDIAVDSRVSSELNGGAVIRDAYSGGYEGTSVELYTVLREHDEPGGHVWFTDDVDGTSPSQLLWDFLSSHTVADGS